MTKAIATLVASIDQAPAGSTSIRVLSDTTLRAILKAVPEYSKVSYRVWAEMERRQAQANKRWS